MPRKVPTNAAATLRPISSGGPPSAPIVITTPSTAATMPSPGSESAMVDETAVFSQRRNFRLLSDHLVQKGPAFQHPMEVSINGSTGQVTVHSTGDDGQEKVVTEHLDLPPDLANGMVLTLLKNV